MTNHSNPCCERCHKEKVTGHLSGGEKVLVPVCKNPNCPCHTQSKSISEILADKETERFKENTRQLAEARKELEAQSTIPHHSVTDGVEEFRKGLVEVCKYGGIGMCPGCGLTPEALDALLTSERQRVRAKIEALRRPMPGDRDLSLSFIRKDAQDLWNNVFIDQLLQALDTK